MIRYLLLALALLATPAHAQSLTLGNLKTPIARICGTAPATSIKMLWAQINLCPTAHTHPAPTPAPPTEPIVRDTTGPLAGLPQLASIPSNFDRALEMTTMGIPPSMAPDVVGAFRMTCSPSHNAYVDPIVYPGQPGASHLHTFFGNTKVDAFSTYTSLRTTGDSTCHSRLNRSAYWIPALLNARGQVVMPDYLTVYYKRFPANSPKCLEGNKCVPLPRGLRMVFGRKMDGTHGGGVYFNCHGAGAISGHYPTLAQAAKNCPAGATLLASASAPACWNGTQLDSLDHRSHLADEYRDPATNTLKCPPSHPYMLPHFILSANYTTDETLDRSGVESTSLQTWHFSSDRMAGMPAQIGGQTFHADWFGAWDDDALAAWQTNCIDGFLSCSTGNLGNGTGLKWTLPGFKANPRLVPVPAPI